MRRNRLIGSSSFALFGALCLTGGSPAFAQDAPPAPPVSPAPPSGPPAPQDDRPDAEPVPDRAGDTVVPAGESQSASQTDILSRRTLSVLLDARLVASDGHTSFVRGGLGKTRFSGSADGGYRVRAVPVEADLIWQPRFTNSLSANVSAGWQRGQENAFDLIEAYATFIPPRGEHLSFSAKAGLYWPEISLEHATGGAWSTVHTITPSAINAWVGEEVKLVGAEATLTASLGAQEISASAGVFGLNDTSGTLLSFRGWALHDIKATAFGHFPLPPLNPFIRLLQEDRTRSTIELDNRPGFYGRLEWRPPSAFTVNAFYYDNRGNPEAFRATGQWGWRTRFLNVGASAQIGPGTRLLAQGMAGSTQMGFRSGGEFWVHTYYRSAYLLAAHEIGRAEVSGRIEAFGTREHGSEMSPDESEDGWAFTLAGRLSITSRLTGFVEYLHVESDRGTRRNLGLTPFEPQNVFQAALRLRL